MDKDKIQKDYEEAKADWEDMLPFKPGDKIRDKEDGSIHTITHIRFDYSWFADGGCARTSNLIDQYELAGE